MNVNELARRVGIAPHVVRYYTQCGLLRPVRNARNAYREYAEADFRRLQFICRAKVIGFSLEEIDLILRAAEESAKPSARVKQVVQARSLENERRLVEAQRLQQRIRDAIKSWGEADDTLTDSDRVRSLIDALSVED